MATALEYEQKTGVMLRAITDEVKRRFDNVMTLLYDNTYKSDSDYRKAAKEWAVIITDFFDDEDVFEDYTALIQLYLENKENIWDDKEWRLLMRMELPKQFRKLMKTFTQVPRLAAIDEIRDIHDKKQIKWWKDDE